MHAISPVSALRQLAMLGALSTGARDCDTTNVCSVARWHGVDLHNNTIRITLTSKSVADRLSTYSCGRDRFFEVFLILPGELQGVNYVKYVRNSSRVDSLFSISTGFLRLLLLIIHSSLTCRMA